MASSRPNTWAEFLDQLDSALDRVERAVDVSLAQAPSDSESVPEFSEHLQWLLDDDSLGLGGIEHLGQMAESDGPRARELYVRQAGVMDRVRAAQGEIRSHVNLVQSASSRERDAPAYLDIHG